MGPSGTRTHNIKLIFGVIQPGAESVSAETQTETSNHEAQGSVSHSGKCNICHFFNSFKSFKLKANGAEARDLFRKIDKKYKSLH